MDIQSKLEINPPSDTNPSLSPEDKLTIVLLFLYT